MNYKRPLKKVLYIIIPLLLVGFVIFKLKTNKAITEGKVYQFDKSQAINIETDTLQLKKLHVENRVSGLFEPNMETKISAESQGKVNVVFIDAGSVVKKGETLIQLDNSLLKLQLQTVSVQIEGLEADVNRYTILAKADAIQGIQLEKAMLGLKSAKAQEATLLEQINKSAIKAPFNGIVTAKLTDVGAFAAPGVPLLQISDITQLKFTINVPERDINLYKLNQTYTLSADVYPEIELNGKVIMIGSKANLGNSFPIQFSIQNTPDLKIKAGMFGVVDLKDDLGEMGIIIPSSTIIGNINQAQVYVVKNQKAHLQDITISRTIGNNVVVSKGLNAGDIIVKSGSINLFEGANVESKNDSK